MASQNRLVDFPIDEDAARKLALLEIRETLGTIPVPGDPRRDDSHWVIPIVVRYPRAIFSAEAKAPERMRFMDFGELGKVKLDSQTGEIVDRTRYYDLQHRIQDRLTEIRNTVEKALVKSSAERFARMAFPEHMHSPVLDLLSWIMIHGELGSPKLESLAGPESGKYIRYVRMLETVGLLEMRDDLIAPTSYFIEIESQQKSLNDRVTDALSFYYSRGYEQIDSIRQFVGPQLMVSGFVYEASLGVDEPIATPYSDIERALHEGYRETKKVLQLPRYLAQLEGVELLVRTSSVREPAWQPSAEAYGKFLEESHLLEPVLSLLHA